MKKSFFFLTCIIGLLSLVGCSKDESYSNSEDTTKSTKIRWYGVKTSDKSTTRGVADEGNLWNQRVGIYVKFLNEPKDETKLDEIRQIATEWEEYAGIKFHFVNGEAKANVRIAFDWQGNDWLTWSYTGTDAKTVTDQTQPTAVLAGADDVNNDTFKGDVLRLFGQILGLEYEQRHQDWNAWKNEAQLQSYWEDQFDGMNMDWDQIREYVFVPLTTQNAVHSVQTDELDELSIMAWPYYTKRQTNKIIANFELSEGDKSFIAKLYPKENQTLPTIQEAWVDAGYFEWATKENWRYEGVTDINYGKIENDWVDGTVTLRMTRFGAEQEYLPDVSDGEQLNSACGIFYYMPYGILGNKLKRAPKFNSSNISDFSYMFARNLNLENVSSFDTSKGTDFENMFYDCQKLNAVPFFNTSEGINFSGIFYNCKELENIPHFETSAGTNFNSMFDGCEKINVIPLLDTSNGTDFTYMFGKCNITSIPLINTSKGISFRGMFSGSSIKNLPLINTSKGNDFSDMFFDTRSLTEIPLLDTSNGTDFNWMFAGSNISTIPLLNTSKGTSFYRMFNGATNLKSIPLLDTSNGTNFSYMFASCPSLTNIPLLNTSKGINFSFMFAHCFAITNIPLLNTSKGTDFSLMFIDCSSLQEKPQLDLSSATETTDMYHRTPFENTL